MKNYILLLITLFIMGCASNGQLDSESETNDVNGIIVASITIGGPGNDARFYYQKVGTNDGLPMTAIQKNINTQRKAKGRMRAKPKVISKFKNDFNQKNIKTGRVLAFEAPEGNYELDRWEIYIFWVGVEDMNIRPRKISPLPFSVKAGEITYIGNLHLETTTKQSIFNRPVAAGGYGNITDQQDIDLPIFKEKYPNLKDFPINIDVPETLEWGIR